MGIAPCRPGRLKRQQRSGRRSSLSTMRASSGGAGSLARATRRPSGPSASQAHPKFCMHGYLFPMPIALGPFPHPSYDTTAVYRGFWTAFIMLAVAAGLVGGLLLVCGVPFVSPRSYKVGGGFLLASGALFLLLIFLFVMWKEFVADFQKYILLERSEMCTDDVPVHVYYGWSFMFAAAGVPLALLSGLLFYLIGRDIMESLE
ncbi:transmembrane protein 182 isoform X2 [Balearica regulorum gibbericeps]|uniref:transmembrane protein 182 isoform X2 n=1 Tax=Balearica regulorum gibbericeps TaxID=100784 RepID=UPI003F5F3AFE